MPIVRSLVVLGALLVTGCFSPTPRVQPLTSSESAGQARTTELLSPSPSPAANASPGLTAPTFLPTPTPTTLFIARTEGSGVILRRTPGSSGERVQVWPDGTAVLGLGESQQVEGRAWTRVRDPSGNEGWIAAEFLVDRATFVSLPTATPVPRTATPAQSPTPAGPTSTPGPAVTPQPSLTPGGLTTTPLPGPTVTPLAGPTVTALPATRAVAGAPAPPQGGNCPPAYPIKAYKNATGDLVFHVPSGQLYAVTQPDMCFATAADAQAAGYRQSAR